MSSAHLRNVRGAVHERKKEIKEGIEREGRPKAPDKPGIFSRLASGIKEKIAGHRENRAAIKRVEERLKSNTARTKAHDVARQTGVPFEDALKYTEEQEKYQKRRDAVKRVAKGLASGLSNMSKGAKKNFRNDFSMMGPSSGRGSRGGSDFSIMGPSTFAPVHSETKKRKHRKGKVKRGRGSKGRQIVINI